MFQQALHVPLSMAANRICTLLVKMTSRGQLKHHLLKTHCKNKHNKTEKKKLSRREGTVITETCIS